MNRRKNVFILTTEYHFLLAIHIISERFVTSDFENTLVFTSERLSAVQVQTLPSNIKVVKFDAASDGDIKTLANDLVTNSLANIFVFTAYRDIETYLLHRVGPSVVRHLIQDGANFYSGTKKSLYWSRLKETLRIYRNLWRKGIFFIKPVLYKKHLAASNFIDHIWVTNPEVYTGPAGYKQAVSTIALLEDSKIKDDSLVYFGLEKKVFNGVVIYLSSRLTDIAAIDAEIQNVRLMRDKLRDKGLIIKLHPYSTKLQVELFRAAFQNLVIKDFVPAELYIMNAHHCYIVGVASVALFYHNPACVYFSVIKLHQEQGIYPSWIEVRFPAHVRTISDFSNFRSMSMHDHDRHTES